MKSCSNTKRAQLVQLEHYTNEPYTNIVLPNHHVVGVSVSLEYDHAVPKKATVNIGNSYDSVETSEYGIYKWLGIPDFIQSTKWPYSKETGKPYMYLCTIYDEWGDMGNNNIFVELDGEDLVDVYHEYSCH